MKISNQNAKIKSVKIESINILNPRSRNSKVFSEIIENIKRVGLKRPITVTHSKSNVSGFEYDLICGQGRIEAFQACAQTHIPAVVIDETEEMTLLKGLVENLARRHHRPLDHFVGIKALQARGYSAKIISTKTGLNEPYTKIILDLLKRGEERLLRAVATGQLPVSVAVQIASSPDDEQRALQEAYESNQLRGEKLRLAQRLLETRKLFGKGVRQDKYRENRQGQKKKISGRDVIKIYQKEVDRKKLLTRKADQVNRQMLFIVDALRQLLADDKFVTLLRNEDLKTIPKQISNLMELEA